MHSPRLLLAFWAPSVMSATPTGEGQGGRRGGWIILLLAVGVALDLLISVVLVYQNRKIEQAASSAHISRVSAQQACLDGNNRAAADAKRWAAILRLLETNPANAELSRFIVGVKAANGAADQTVDCSHLVP